MNVYSMVNKLPQYIDNVRHLGGSWSRFGNMSPDKQSAIATRILAVTLAAGKFSALLSMGSPLMVGVLAGALYSGYEIENSSSKDRLESLILGTRKFSKEYGPKVKSFITSVKNFVGSTLFKARTQLKIAS